MRSFVQKHGKIIMTVLGVTLMFVFALPTFRNNIDISSIVVGKLNGKKITHNDMQGAQNELRLLEHFGMDGPVRALLSDDRDRAAYWFLLVREASQYGFASMSDAQVNQMLSSRWSESEIDRDLNEMDSARRYLRDAVAHLTVVYNYVVQLENEPRPVSSLELVAERQLNKIRVVYAALDAAQGWQDAPTPTEEQIRKQFDLYKGILHTPASPLPSGEPRPLPPEIDGHHYPYGYKYPDRAAVEYLVFDRAAIRARLKPTQADYDDAYKYFREHAEEFRNSAPATGTVSTQPASKTFDEVKESLVNRQIDDRVNKLIRKMTDRILTQAGEPWKNRETVPPDQWVNYQNLADEIAKNKELDNYRPEYKSSGQLLGAEELTAAPGIGSASYRVPNQTDTFYLPELATHVRELVELSARDPMARLFLQVGTEGPLLQDSAGNVYVYRVTKVEKSHDPASLEEVRTRVVDDLKKLATYQRRAQEAKDLAAAANNHGDLSTLAKEKNLIAQTTPEFNHVEAQAPLEIRGIRNFVDTAFSLVSSTTSQPATTSAVSKSATTQIAGGAGTVLASDDTLKCYVLQLLQYTPATGADFAGQRRELISQLDPTLVTFLRNYLSLDSLAARQKYVPVTPFPKPREEAN